MTLSFSSFSIKDILTGRDAREKLGTGFTEELCAPERRGFSGRAERVPELTHPNANENRIQAEIRPADLRLSIGHLRSHTYCEEATGPETELGGERLYSNWQCGIVKTAAHIDDTLSISFVFIRLDFKNCAIQVFFYKLCDDMFLAAFAMIAFIHHFPIY